MPRKHEMVVNLLLLVLVIVLILLIMWAITVLYGITPGKTLVEEALNFT